MNRWTIMLTGLLLGASVTAGQAGSACCPYGSKAAPVAAKTEQAADAQKMCGDACLEGIQLTADQKTKVAELMDQCHTAGGTPASTETLTAGLEKVLTADQMEKMKANCVKNGCGVQQASS